MFIKLMLAVSCFAALFIPTRLQACTLYAAQGELVQGGGTLVAKIRDFKPGYQKMHLNKEGTYSFYGLYGSASPGSRRMGVRAGINEKGLAVFTAMASVIPKVQRQAYPHSSCIKRLLQDCSSVDKALKCKDAFLGPKFVLLADAEEIALVEVGEEGNTVVTRTRNAYLHHTNHYLSPEMSYLNIRYKESSHTRYGRMQELLESTSAPFTLETFKSFSQDQHDGLDNSIWRVGSRRNISQSLGAFIADIRSPEDFTIWIKYRPKPEDAGKEQYLELTKQDIFD